MSALLPTLSSPWTRFWKAFPLLFVGVWLVMLTHAYLTRDADTFVAGVVLLIVLIPAMTFMHLRYRRLVDRAEIAGDRLLLVRRGQEQHVPLADVLSVNPGMLNAPTIVSVRLRKAGPFGDEVHFASRMSSPKWTSTRLHAVESLIMAVDAAKLGRRG